VVRGGRGSSREGSTKERGGGATAVLENGKEEIGGAGDERGEGRRCRVQSGDETDRGAAATAEEIGLRGGFVAWASPLPLHILYSP
jgi:hypothetical protein